MPDRRPYVRFSKKKVIRPISPSFTRSQNSGRLNTNFSNAACTWHTFRIPSPSSLCRSDARIADFIVASFASIPREQAQVVFAIFANAVLSPRPSAFDSKMEEDMTMADAGQTPTAGRPRDEIVELQAALEESRTLASRKQLQLEEMQASFARLNVYVEDQEYHQSEIEGQFMNDQTELKQLAKSQKQMTEQHMVIAKLQHSMIERTNETINLRARLRIHFSQSAQSPRKGDNVEVPLDPVPLVTPTVPPPEGPPDISSTFLDQKFIRSLAIEIHNIEKANGKKTIKVTVAEDAPVKPMDKAVTYFSNALLCKTIYKKFGVEGAADFMAHEPVTPAEMDACVVPAEDEYRWDFSPGYLRCQWNRVIVGRVVDKALAADALAGRTLGSVDRKWLEQQVVTQLSRFRMEWSRVQPKITRGQLESPDDARNRAMGYILHHHITSKSTSSKLRKYKTREATIALTIELKESDGTSKNIDTWKRFMQVLKYLGSSGMSSEEEGEVEVNSQRIQIYKIKLCIWRAAEVVDFWRFVDAQTDKIMKRRTAGGVKSAPRFRTTDHGTSDTPKGLPESLYSSDWLGKLKGTRYYPELNVSAESFGLFIAATSRMNIAPSNDLVMCLAQTLKTYHLDGSSDHQLIREASEMITFEINASSNPALVAAFGCTRRIMLRYRFCDVACFEETRCLRAYDAVQSTSLVQMHMDVDHHVAVSRHMATMPGLSPSHCTVGDDTVKPRALAHCAAQSSTTTPPPLVNVVVLLPRPQRHLPRRAVLLLHADPRGYFPRPPTSVSSRSSTIPGPTTSNCHGARPLRGAYAWTW
ncbi:hypothetical protein B0H17DRAFT_1127586 [Mycena rosella]|uniref:Uncharacterized protein n=1 Tax=Mycena rosella TaxID=1033263 RepID=A0AAD7DZP0_MYCRO|nr:hypothetical protein B0H17DRAFT_1127586 [Mycena rosella]